MTGVVDEAVDHGGGDDVVAEDLAPAAEDLVAGDDQGGSLVAGGHQLEEQVRGFGFEGDVADFVDHQQGVAAQADWRASHISDSGPNKVRPEMEDHQCERNVGSSLRSSSPKLFGLWSTRRVLSLRLPAR